MLLIGDLYTKQWAVIRLSYGILTLLSKTTEAAGIQWRELICNMHGSLCKLIPRSWKIGWAMVTHKVVARFPSPFIKKRKKGHYIYFSLYFMIQIFSSMRGFFLRVYEGDWLCTLRMWKGKHSGFIDHIYFWTISGLTYEFYYTKAIVA